MSSQHDSAAWYYAQGRQRIGPVSLADLRALAAADRIQATTMLLQEGGQRWVPAGQLAGLFPPAAAAPAIPKAPPAPPARGGSRLPHWLAPCAAALRGMTVESVREGSRRVQGIRARRQIARLRGELQERLPAEVGAQLLSEGLLVPGGEEVVQRYRSLSRAFSLASQGALTGDKARKKETQEVARQLQALYVEYGQKALAQPAPFPGRQQIQDRQQRLAEQIRQKEDECARRQAQWQAAPRSTRGWVRAGWCLGALAPLLLLAVLLKGMFGPAPVLGGGTDSPEAARAKAQAVLVASEEEAWSLQGEALLQAQRILGMDEAGKEVSGEDMSPDQREKRLRAFLRSRRPKGAQEKARSLLGGLNDESRQFVEQTADSMKMKPEDLVLEWLTYEGALSLGLLTRTWHDRDSLKKQDEQLITAVFEGMKEPPAPARGVQVRREDNRIEVSLFGARVQEEIADRPAAVEGNQVVLWWKSSYGELRDLVRGQAPDGLSKKVVTAEQGRYAPDYRSQLEAYLAGGHHQPWATSVREDALPGLVDALGRGGSRTPLQQLFARLAPSVPLIKAVGRSSGSGFLVRHRDSYLVITNRHVIEGADKGVVVEFLKSTGNEEPLTVPTSQTTVVAIHRKADLAVIDVSAAAEKIRAQGLQPVTLAGPQETPPVGAHVFAIGHPGGGGTLLTRTLSDGIVSATGREAEGARYLQVTVPLNPGNSGGPLFDDDGHVVGVNTFVLRKSEGRDMALEALNFALEIRYVHEILKDPYSSLDAKGITAVLRPPAAPLEKSPLGAAFKKMVDRHRDEGFRPHGGSAKEALRFSAVPPHTKSVFTFTLSAGRSYAAAVVSQGAGELRLAVLTDRGTVLAADTSARPDPSIRFQVRGPGKHTLVIANPSGTEALAILAVFEK